MIAVFENGKKTLAEPMERLHKAHGGTACPVEAAGRGSLKVEGEIAEGDGPQATIGEYGDACGNGVSESKIVGGGDAIDHHPHLALAGQRVVTSRGLG